MAIASGLGGYGAIPLGLMMGPPPVAAFSIRSDYHYPVPEGAV